jgi:hypothetical protein
MAGRGEKGLLISTAIFTFAAYSEATRDGLSLARTCGVSAASSCAAWGAGPARSRVVTDQLCPSIIANRAPSVPLMFAAPRWGAGGTTRLIGDAIVTATIDVSPLLVGAAISRHGTDLTRVPAACTAGVGGTQRGQPCPAEVLRGTD